MHEATRQTRYVLQFMLGFQNFSQTRTVHASVSPAVFTYKGLRAPWVPGVPSSCIDAADSVGSNCWALLPIIMSLTQRLH